MFCNSVPIPIVPFVNTAHVVFNNGRFLGALYTLAQVKTTLWACACVPAHCIFHHTVTMTLEHTVATMTLVHIIVTMILNHNVGTMLLDHTVSSVPLDTIVPSVIPLVSLLISSPMKWHKEHLWNFSVLQRVHLSKLVSLPIFITEVDFCRWFIQISKILEDFMASKSDKILSGDQLLLSIDASDFLRWFNYMQILSVYVCLFFFQITALNLTLNLRKLYSVENSTVTYITLAQ
jgi:hypothetical protein